MIIKLKININMALKDIMVSVFPNVKIKDAPEHFPLLDILDYFKSGNSDYRKRLAVIQKEEDHTKRNELKVKILPVFCPSGTFERMEDNKLIGMSGVICIDLDDVPHPESEIDKLKSFNYVLSVFKSPSGKGLKIMVLHDLTEPSHHKSLYYHVGTLLGLTKRTDLKFDMSCSNISHPCFWSHDSSLYLNRKATPLHINLDDFSGYTSSSIKKEVSGDGVSKKDGTAKVIPLTDPEKIRKQVLESHSLFEKFYSMYPSVRNKHLFVLTKFFYNDSIPKDFAIDYLIAYYADSSNGFPASEIKKIVHSAYH